MKEVLDFSVSEYSSTGYGDFIFSVDYAKSSNVKTTGERLEITGGQGNYKIMDLDHSKKCTFSSILPIVDIKALGVKLGKDVETGAVDTPIKEILTVGATNKASLTNTPTIGTLKVYLLSGERDLGTEQEVGNPGTTENKYSILAKEITLNSTTCPKDTKIVVFYEYTSGATAQNIKITAADFPTFITITGRSLVDDDVTGKKIPVSFKVHKCKVKPEWELVMGSDSATELAFDCDCYTVLNSDNEREFIDIVKLNDEAIG
jgi:hypothetical protein